MIELLTQKLKPFHSEQEKYHFLREYFQLLILKVMDEQGFFQYLSFMGGTALRILYDLERFSEDLDFNLIERQGFSFEKMLTKIEQELSLMGFHVELTHKEKNTVAVAHIKFISVLHALGLSSLKDQKIMIKLEIDQNPPAGARSQFSVINKEFLLSLYHLEQPSLFAGKLLALFCRKYTKGRDYYDLMWFLSKKIHPNLDYLNAGLHQKNRPFQCNSLSEVKTRLQETIKHIDFKAVLQDVGPFLIDPKQARFFTPALFQGMVEAAF